MIPFPDKKYQIIYADPPWDYKGQVQHNGPGVRSFEDGRLVPGTDTGGAVRHYSCLSLDELKAFPVQELADDSCLLFLWVTNPHLDQGIELMKAWGFHYATVAFVWDKQRVNPGFYTMSQCELVLVGRKGTIPAPRGARNARQMVSIQRGEHSAKPEEVRNRINACFLLRTRLSYLLARNLKDGIIGGMSVK